MGLDVYLYRYDRFIEEVRDAERAYEEETLEIYCRLFGKDRAYESLTDEERQRYTDGKRALARRLFLDENGESPAKVDVRQKSVRHPDHLFQIGYFRSSYNGAGFNKIVNDRIGTDLHDLFPAPEKGDEFIRVVDWKASHQRAKLALARLAEYIAEHGNFLVLDIEATNLFGPAPAVEDAADALALYAKERKRHYAGPNPWKGGYSSRDGQFYHDEPAKVVAFIPGTQSILRKVPCVYAIVEPAAGEPALLWYVQALDVVLETCEWVLAQPDPARYVLHWSG